MTTSSRTLMERVRARPLNACLAALPVLLLTACGGSQAPKEPTVQIDQANLCEVRNYGLATACTPGQKVVFLPQSFGNEQLPILFAAINCDLRYQVALTNGAVTCIFAPITPAAPESPENPPAHP